VARRLRSVPFDVIHYSDMLRAEQTAKIISQRLAHVPMRRTALLREGHPGIRGQRASKQRVVVRKRMNHVAERYFRPARSRDRHELLVCHGNLIRYLLMRVLDVPTGTWWRMDMYQGGLSVVRIEAAGLFVHTHNDAAHLPVDARTFL